MISAYTLQQSVNWASQFVGLQPLVGVGGFANEPALTIANTVAQIITGAPLKWRWNRQDLTATTAANNSMATLSVLSPGLAFIERAYLSSPAIELEIKQVLPTTEAPGRPSMVSPQLESTSNANITLIFAPIPDQVYTVNVIGQSAAPLFTALTQTWSPIPDYLGHIYNTGFLAFAMLYAQHPGFQLMFMRFLSSLVGASEGLTDQEKSVFIGNYQHLLQSQKDIENGQLLGTKGRFGIQV